MKKKKTKKPEESAIIKETIARMKKLARDEKIGRKSNPLVGG